MSPPGATGGAGGAGGGGGEARPELLGSLTTQQQQRTSARVIKKLMLEPLDKSRPDIPDCDIPTKQIEEKEPLKFPTVKQRMPKALWSADEKSLFFEALNEYGKDFDAVTAYIRAKMKKKGMLDGNLKTKTQVSHFYYRTWHKLSKHVRFDENVKKVAQELYALINYGELRRKLVAVNEKTCARLGELVRTGGIVVRARGRNLRVRTPQCRALRRLNQIAEVSLGVRVCVRVLVELRARSVAAWRRVQAAAHNPRAAAALPPATPLRALLAALARRWQPPCVKKERITHEIDKLEDNHSRDTDDGLLLPRFADDVRYYNHDEEDRDDLEDHLNLETDRVLIQESKLPRRPALHVGPRAGAALHLPVVAPSEPLSSQKICLDSYLARMRQHPAKIRATKRQRKDSAADKDPELKKLKQEDGELGKLVDIEESAVDVELMAGYRSLLEDDDKMHAYTTEDEKEMKSEETAEEEAVDLQERDKDMSEREKDSFSEMEDDEKYTKSDSENDSDNGKSEKIGKERKFKNLKVKFRIRPKKLGDTIYSMVDKDQDEIREEKIGDEKIGEEKIGDEKMGEEKIGDEKIGEEKLEEDKSECNVDVAMALSQIRKGWSVYDAGELTIGDLYLMFGSRSRIELDYWWAEPTPPLPSLKPQKQTEKEKSPSLTCDKDKTIEKKEKMDKSPEKGTDSSVEDEKTNENELLSPKNTFSQDSNDGLSGDERKTGEPLAGEALAGDALSGEGLAGEARGGGTLRLASKLVNSPVPAPDANDALPQMTDRLKRLLALVSNAHVSPAAGIGVARCECGHMCPKKQRAGGAAACRDDDGASTFRHPPPIAPRPPAPRGNPGEKPGGLLSGLPRRRRGRPPLSPRRVVVQRLLPLLPALPQPNNLIPVKLMPNSPAALPKILPKPSPVPTAPLSPGASPRSQQSVFYVLSEVNGQFFFHDGDRKIPITPLQDAPDDSDGQDAPDAPDTPDAPLTHDAPDVPDEDEEDLKEYRPETADPLAAPDMPAEFLPSESMSLSPSHLLRDSEGWLEGAQDFSLSSFLGHLEGRTQPVDSQLRSLMVESSVDYVAKFADLAAEVAEGNDPIEPLESKPPSANN